MLKNYYLFNKIFYKIIKIRNGNAICKSTSLHQRSVRTLLKIAILPKGDFLDVFDQIKKKLVKRTQRIVLNIVNKTHITTLDLASVPNKSYNPVLSWRCKSWKFETLFIFFTTFAGRPFSMKMSECLRFVFLSLKLVKLSDFVYFTDTALPLFYIFWSF